MSEYFTGNDRVRSDFADQAATLYERYKFVVVAGSVGRQAMYGHFEYDDVPPLPLVRPDARWYESPLRDFDLAQPYGRHERPYRLNATGRHPVDLRVGMPFHHAVPNQVGFLAHARSLDPAVLKPHTRYVEMDGFLVPFRTFSIGTQYCLEEAGRVYGVDDDKYARARQMFATFARQMFAEHPEEFLPAEAYEPLLRLNPYTPGEALPWGDMERHPVVSPASQAQAGYGRERIELNARPGHTPSDINSVGALLEDIHAVQWLLGRAEECVVNRVHVASHHNYDALSLLQNAAGENPKEPFAGIITGVQDAQRHLGAAMTALYATDSGLSLYHLEVSGALHAQPLGD